MFRRDPMIKDFLQALPIYNIVGANFIGRTWLRYNRNITNALNIHIFMQYSYNRSMIHSKKSQQKSIQDLIKQLRRITYLNSQTQTIKEKQILSIWIPNQ